MAATKQQILADIDETIRFHRNEVADLERAAALLRKGAAPARKRQRVSPSRAAGRQAIERVGDVLREVGTTTQAEITKRTGLNSGTVSHALHVLQEEGKAAPTGERQARSLVWEPQA